MSHAIQCLNLKQAAEALGVSPYTARLWAIANKIPAIRVGRRWLVPVEELKEFIAEKLRGRGSPTAPPVRWQPTTAAGQRSEASPKLAPTRPLLAAELKALLASGLTDLEACDKLGLDIQDYNALKREMQDRADAAGKKAKS